MRQIRWIVLALLLGSAALAGKAKPAVPARLNTGDFSQPFLLQGNYEEQEPDGTWSFMTSRSRIVRFVPGREELIMLDATGPEADTDPPRVLAKIPIRRETPGGVDLDLNAGFDAIYLEEDRTGEDYYGRDDKQDYRSFPLLERQALATSRHGDLLAFDQSAKTEDGSRIVAHYYLSPYRPDPDFRPFEMQNLDHFGFFETYPQPDSGDSILYAMKFDAHEPIVFALSSAIPAPYRDAVRDGVLYWNRALGEPLLRVVDAPPGVRAPSPDYNVIEWVSASNFGSTSYIQSDPLTGQILHAHVFVLKETMMDGELADQIDHLRFIVAHEVGHALGLRHNFAKGPATTVMGYFMLSRALQIGRDIGAGKPALPYDRQVMRHVYIGDPLDVDSLPPFCTDSQRGCSRFPPLPPRENVEVIGNSAARALP